MDESNNEDIVVIESDDKPTRVMPQSELDLQLMTTDTVWGSQIISKTLKEKLTEGLMFEKDGKTFIKKKGLWELLGFYTRDFRLGNLSSEQMKECAYMTNLANDYLRDDFIKAFLVALSRVATILELSQSRSGFLRRRINTLTQEHFKEEIEPKKKNMFGMINKDMR